MGELFGTSARSVRALYAYFRGAEYPLGRVAALRAAVGMAREGWPHG